MQFFQFIKDQMVYATYVYLTYGITSIWCDTIVDQHIKLIQLYESQGGLCFILFYMFYHHIIQFMASLRFLLQLFQNLIIYLHRMLMYFWLTNFFYPFTNSLTISIYTTLYRNGELWPTILNRNIGDRYALNKGKNNKIQKAALKLVKQVALYENISLK